MERPVVSDLNLGLLNPIELDALEITADLSRALTLVVGRDASRSQDIAELFHHIHAIQRYVMSHAACRAYPDKFRMLGGTIPGV